MAYLVLIPHEIELQIKKLHPVLKRQVRAALDELALNPHQGKPLEDDLKGLHSYRVARYRIIYKIRQSVLEVQVIALGHRANIYEHLR